VVADKIEEAKQVLEVKQAKAVQKVQEFKASPIGERMNSGEQLTVEEIKKVAETIPAPIPLVEKVDEAGEIKMGFSKPIAVPTAKNKTKMVGLLMENNMIELSLTSGATSKVIIGKPAFDKKAFEGAGAPQERRKLSAEEAETDAEFQE